MLGHRVVAAQYHRGALSDKEVGEGWTGLDAPLRMAATPSGDALVLAMGNGGLMQLDLERHPGEPARLVPALGALLVPYHTYMRTFIPWYMVAVTPSTDAAVLATVSCAAAARPGRQPGLSATQHAWCPLWVRSRHQCIPYTLPFVAGNNRLLVWPVERVSGGWGRQGGGAAMQGWAWQPRLLGSVLVAVLSSQRGA